MPVTRISIGDDPVVSVVVPTVPGNDHDHIKRELVTQQFDGDYEILIVSDDSIDICEARNEGIRRARGDVVALTDDDCTPPDDWVAEIHRYFDAIDDLVCLEGSVQGGMNYDGVRHYFGCNIAFDRDAALAVGGFDSDFAGWRDDTEFGWRMEREADGKNAYVSTVRMCHEPRPRASFDPETEALLKERYAQEYDEVMNSSLEKRAFRVLLRLGVVKYINRLRYESK